MTLAILSAIANEQKGLGQQLKALQSHEFGGRVFHSGELHGLRAKPNRPLRAGLF